MAESSYLPPIFQCHPKCPNRKTILAKGYSYLLVVIILSVLVLGSIKNLKHSEKGMNVEVEQPPITLSLPCLILILFVAGVDTDKVAESLGKFLSSGKQIM